MSKEILQQGEVVELQENGYYCKSGGAMASVNAGTVLLTNKRLVICKSAAAMIAIIPGIVIAAVIAFWLGYNGAIGALEGALIGGVIGGVSAAIGNAIAKKSKKIPNKMEVSFARADINSVEDGSRGIHKMLVVKTKNGETCKIKVTDKDMWRAALLK